VRILVIDNYDSFVYNLVQYLGQLGADCEVRRSDELSVTEAVRRAGAGVLLSPGPGTPAQAGVCLGHQAIAAAYGARLAQAPELLHGRTSLVQHTGAGVLAGLPVPFTATRYHSLAVVESSLPSELAVTARTVGSGATVMAMRHRTLPIEGVQFHPESVLTEAGHKLLANWLTFCGLPEALSRAPSLAAEVEARRRTAFAAT
jgi:para-aminobenzoate synthetase component 2